MNLFKQQLLIIQFLLLTLGDILLLVLGTKVKKKSFYPAIKIIQIPNMDLVVSNIEIKLEHVNPLNMQEQMVLITIRIHLIYTMVHIGLVLGTVPAPPSNTTHAAHGMSIVMAHSGAGAIVPVKNLQCAPALLLNLSISGE